MGISIAGQCVEHQCTSIDDYASGVWMNVWVRVAQREVPMLQISEQVKSHKRLRNTLFDSWEAREGEGTLLRIYNTGEAKRTHVVYVDPSNRLGLLRCPKKLGT